MIIKTKILIAGLIEQEPKITKEYLKSLEELDKQNLREDYFFVITNENQNVMKLLKEFKSKIKRRVTIKSESARKSDDFKDSIIRYSRKNTYDYIFLTEGNALLHPATLKHLIGTGKDIISEALYSNWGVEEVNPPKISLYDTDLLHWKDQNKKLFSEQLLQEKRAFREKLADPGIYEAGGLTGCLLLSKKVLQSGINFSRIRNVEFWGRDYTFIIKARVFGISAFVDTTYPAYHILEKDSLDDWRLKNSKTKDIYTPDLSDNFQKSEIETKIKDFIRVFLSCDYRIVTGFEGLQYLTASYSDKVIKRQGEMLNALVKNEICCLAYCTKISLNTDRVKDGTVIAKVDFSLELNKKQLLQDDKFKCEITLINDKNLSWLIQSTVFKNKEGKVLLSNSLVDIISGKERVIKYKNNKVTLVMLIKCEAGTTWKIALSHVAQYIDNAIIMDADGTRDLNDECKKILKDIPFRFCVNKYSDSIDEQILRIQLWDMAVQLGPDWILCLDEDEYFEDDMVWQMGKLINQPYYDLYEFPEYNTQQSKSKSYKILLARYQPNFSYVWSSEGEKDQRFPNNLHLLDGCQCEIMLKRSDKE